MSTLSKEEHIHDAKNSEDPIRTETTTHGQLSSPLPGLESDKQNTAIISSLKTPTSRTLQEPDIKGSVSSDSRKRNAFSALMNPKPKQQKTTHTATTNQKPPQSRPTFTSGLLAYITNPDSFPSGTIIRETEHTILIRDLYPKSLVHLLLLPKDPKFYDLDPFEAFNPPNQTHTDFLALIRTEAKSAASLAVSELSRLTAPHSKSCQDRNDALASDDPPSSLPSGRDFLPDIKIGVHAAPSMDTLHIHIVSVDNYSPALKHRKHYNSFNTSFFIDLDEFPLTEENVNMTPDGQEKLMKGDMKCWRCGRNFGNKFKQLKDHLTEEYEEWRKV